MKVQAEIYVTRNHRHANQCQPARGPEGGQPGGCFEAPSDGHVAGLHDGPVGQIYHAVAETYQKGKHGHLHWQKLDGPAAPIPEKSGQLKHAPDLLVMMMMMTVMMVVSAVVDQPGLICSHPCCALLCLLLIQTLRAAAALNKQK